MYTRCAQLKPLTSMSVMKQKTDRGPASLPKISGSLLGMLVGDF